MLDVKLDRGAWVVVCDGAKAIILENVGSRVAPSLKTREVYQQDDPMTQELGTDEPGRTFQSVGNRRSAMEQTDWHQQNEQRFLAKLAGRLDRAVQGGAAKAMIVIAPPRALGMLRQEFSPHVKNALHAEIDKDFVKLPVDQIEKHIIG